MNDLHSHLCIKQSKTTIHEQHTPNTNKDPGSQLPLEKLDWFVESLSIFEKQTNQQNQTT